MTVKELYEIAKARGEENTSLTFSYSCNDDWYDYEGDVKQTDVHITKGEVCIAISNYGKA